MSGSGVASDSHSHDASQLAKALMAKPGILYTMSQKKTRHQTLAHNFTKYWPIFKILSLLDSAGNM